MDVSREEVPCPLCPMCRRRPLDLHLSIRPWFCENDRCNVLCWDPDISRQANLLNMQQINED